MQLNGGWLVDARRVPSPHHDCRPDDEAPSLLVVHNISLPPGSLAARGSMLYSPERSIPALILSLRKSRTCAFQRIVLFVAMVKLCSMFLLISERGTRAYPAIMGVNAAMTFLSALSWKEPTRWLIPMRSTSSWWR